MIENELHPFCSTDVTKKSHQNGDSLWAESDVLRTISFLTFARNFISEGGKIQKRRMQFVIDDLALCVNNNLLCHNLQESCLVFLLKPRIQSR